MRWRFPPGRRRDPSAPFSVRPPLFSKEFASTYRKPTARKNPIVARSRLLVLIFEKLPRAPHPSPLLRKALGRAPERCRGRLKASYPSDRINSPFLPTQASKRKRAEADKLVIAFWLALVRLPLGLVLERQSRCFRGEQQWCWKVWGSSSLGESGALSVVRLERHRSWLDPLPVHGGRLFTPVAPDRLGRGFSGANALKVPFHIETVAEGARGTSPVCPGAGAEEAELASGGGGGGACRRCPHARRLCPGEARVGFGRAV